mmetsp:Transcript_35186/g.101339  ORF Transcript_35186/g.101339 Transcript_35186/m.101339 type:complete len:183 (+) Transcript_35186:92-640(+)
MDWVDWSVSCWSNVLFWRQMEPNFENDLPWDPPSGDFLYWPIHYNWHMTKKIGSWYQRGMKKNYKNNNWRNKKYPKNSYKKKKKKKMMMKVRKWKSRRRKGCLYRRTTTNKWLPWIPKHFCNHIESRLPRVDFHRKRKKRRPFGLWGRIRRLDRKILINRHCEKQNYHNKWTRKKRKIWIPP